MTTIRTSAPRKTLSLPPTAKNIRAAVKAGARAPKTPAITTPKAPKAAPVVHALNKVSKTIEKVWTESLATAREDYKDALNIEVAVGLALYAQKGAEDKVTLDAKRALMGVYADAGFACKKHTDEDYKTVNRRINACADLYVKLGGRQTITDWIDGAAPKDQILKLVGHVQRYKFEGINSILHYVGKVGTRKRPRNGTVSTTASGAQPQTQADKDMAAMADKSVADRRAEETSTSRRAEDRLPLGRVFQAGAMRAVVPMGATYADVMNVIEQMTKFANDILRVDSEQPTAVVADTKAPATA